MAFEKLFSAGTDINILPDVHTTRLDAEMFTADDLDGVTEGLTGSGNLNYLVLQSQQTNESFAVHDPFSIKGSDFSGSDPIGPGALGIPGFGDNGMRGPGNAAGKGAEANDSLGNSNDIDSGDPTAIVPEGGNNGAVSAISNFGASNVDTSNASDIYNRLFETEIGKDGIGGLDGIGQDGGDGVPGPIGGNGSNGNDGNDGNDGVSPPPPPPPPGPEPVDDVDLQVDIISDIIGVDLDVILDPIENIVGDIDIDIDAILGDILSTDDGILPNPSIIIDGLVGGVQLIDDLHLDVVLTPVENLLTDVVGALNPALGGLLPFLPDPLGLVTGILDGLNAGGDTDLLVNVDLGLPDLFGITGLGAINLDIPLDPVEMLLGDIDLDLSVESMLNDLLTGGLTVPVVDLSLLSTGDVLSGLDAVLSTDDLLGGVSNVVDDLVGGDLLGDNGLLGDGALLDGVLGDGGLLGDGILGGDLLGDGGLLSGDALGGLNDAVESLLGDLGGGLPGGGGDPVGDLLGGLLDGDIINDGIVGDLTDGLLGDLPGGGDPVGDLLGGLLGGSPDDGAGADTDLTVDTGFDLGDAVIDQIDLDATLDPIENLVGDIDIGLNIQTDAVQDLLNGDVGGAVDSVLDNLTNGIDLNLALLKPEDGQNSGLELNADPIIDGVLGGGIVDGVLGDVTGGLLGNGDLDAPGADDDLSIDTGFDLGDVILDQIDLNATLDPVENLVGDIDIGINIQTDAVEDILSGDLEGALDSVVDNLANGIDIDIALLNPEPNQNGGLDINGLGGLGDLLGGGDVGSWPEATVGGDLLGGVGDALGDALGGGNILPEPQGILSEGLGLINETVGGGGGHHGGILGGLGGLFG